MAKGTRTQVTLPRELAEQLDRRIDRGTRSEFVTEIVREWLDAARRREVLERFAGSISAEEHPEWATPEDISAWVGHERASWDRADNPARAG